MPKQTPPKPAKLTICFNFFGMIGLESGPIGQSTAAKFKLEVGGAVPVGPGAYSWPLGIILVLSNVQKIS